MDKNVNKLLLEEQKYWVDNILRDYWNIIINNQRPHYAIGILWN